MTRQRALLLLCAVLATTTTGQFSSSDYNLPWFEGDGTYYGETTGGNCAMRQLPHMYVNMKAVAINNAQYADSKSCGACVEYSGDGIGSGADPIIGKHIAYVHDRCPECHHGSLDLSESGDGRWKIKFRYVPCPFQDDLSFLFEGSNPYYFKLQARGLQYPIKSITVSGIPGIRSQDNFFIVQNGAGHNLPASYVVTDIMDRVFTGSLDTYQGEQDIKPVGVTADVTESPTTVPAQCVPSYRFCEGPRNMWGGTSCCDEKFTCKSQAKYGHKQCVRKDAKCFPLGNWCKRVGRQQMRPCCRGSMCYRQPGKNNAFCVPRI